MVSIWKLNPGECHLSTFDRKRKPYMTSIKEYREQSIELELEAGRYMIVPSCKSPGKYSKFYLNIYFSCGEEMPNTPGNDFKYFKARYVNPYEGEDEENTHGFVNEVEDEDETKFNDKFRMLLEKL